MEESMVCHFDAKGRIMIPAALRERFDFGEAALLVVTRDGLLIREIEKRTEV